jgi:hypothetical protein
VKGLDDVMDLIGDPMNTGKDSFQDFRCAPPPAPARRTPLLKRGSVREGRLCLPLFVLRQVLSRARRLQITDKFMTSSR